MVPAPSPPVIPATPTCGRATSAPPALAPAARLTRAPLSPAVAASGGLLPASQAGPGRSEAGGGAGDPAGGRAVRGGAGPERRVDSKWSRVYNKLWKKSCL